MRELWGVWHVAMPYPKLRGVKAVKEHIGKSPLCLAAGLGVKEAQRETRLSGQQMPSWEVLELLGQLQICETDPLVDAFFG